MNDLDIWRAARLLLDQHGPLVVERACDRIHERCAIGDMEGCTTWSRVLAALNRMRKVEQAAGEQVH